MVDLTHLVTEHRNDASEAIDTLSSLDIVTLINNEDKKVAIAVERTLPAIAQLVDKIVVAFSQGGRLIYCGAGTSGRLGILDASECPPTYGTPPEQVIGLIAGGKQAVFHAVEQAEDRPELGMQDLQSIEFNARDIFVGLAASGRTPYVLGAIHYAKQLGAVTSAITCNPNSEIAQQVDIPITAIVGPEVITGSSRMKAGTAQKLILNMISTAAMIRTGKVFGNLMVDVEATNAKLAERQVHIVMQATQCERTVAEQALMQCANQCKTAILMILAELDATTAQQVLADNHSFIRPALQQVIGKRDAK